jgi:acyl-CoA synthetase (AMP-forming)/AMP-acid ligase II
MSDTLAVSARDKILPVVPMFHANAWGLPYAAALSGADLVLPSKYLQAGPIVALIDSERPTIAGAVPTIWSDVLRYADEHKPDLSSLRCVPCGGSAVPRALIEAFEERHGVTIVQASGMTETSPLGSVARASSRAAGEDAWQQPACAGKIVSGVEVRIVADDGSGCRGTASRLARSRSAGRGSATPTSRTPLSRSSTTGCAPVTSPRSSPAATSASPTARRTSSNPAASGSHPWASRTSWPPTQRFSRSPSSPSQTSAGRSTLACVVVEEGEQVSADERRLPARPRGEVVDPRRVRLHRRGPEDERRQVRQEGTSRAARRR